MNEEITFQWAKALDRISASSTIALISHIRPDGDAYGCTLALGIALESLGKDVILYNQSGILSTYTFLPQVSRVIEPPTAAPNLDMIISLDSSTPERLGTTFAAWKMPVAINIDHHASNSLYGEINIIDPAVPATAQLLYELFTIARWPITPDIAAALYTGIITDTGSFKYRGTTARTFQVAAALAEAGADIANLSEKCFANYPLRRLRLQREVLQKLELRCQERLAFFIITQEMYRLTGAQPEDTEGLIENIISIQNVEVALLFEERKDRTVKVSLRSKGRINVSELAATVGGGGHPLAAGATIRGSLLNAQEDLLPLCVKTVNQLIAAEEKTAQ